jgi:hypothetical protein
MAASRCKRFYPTVYTIICCFGRNIGVYFAPAAMEKEQGRAYHEITRETEAVRSGTAGI